MANRIMLNETSYHGSEALSVRSPNEAKAHGFQKAFVCTDPDLIKFGVAAKVTDVLDKAGLAYEIYSDIKDQILRLKMYSMAWPHLKMPKQYAQQSAAVLLWIRQGNRYYHCQSGI